jgi:hypothetical protein
MEIKDECYGRLEKNGEYYMMPHLMEMAEEDKIITNMHLRDGFSRNANKCV